MGGFFFCPFFSFYDNLLLLLAEEWAPTKSSHASAYATSMSQCGNTRDVMAGDKRMGSNLWWPALLVTIHFVCGLLLWHVVWAYCGGWPA